MRGIEEEEETESYEMTQNEFARVPPSRSASTGMSVGSFEGTWKGSCVDDALTPPLSNSRDVKSKNESMVVRM